jgi:hypothetical protein
MRATKMLIVLGVAAGVTGASAAMAAAGHRAPDYQ